MHIYVVIGVWGGLIEEVKGFLDPSLAEIEVGRLKGEYGIVPGSEEESENSVQLHELDIDASPTSVAIRRTAW